MSEPRGKWRPSLSLVVGGTLAGVLCLPVIGIVIYRRIGAWYVPRIGQEAAWLLSKVVTGLGIAVATTILGLLLYRLLLRPIRALSARAEAIRAGEAPEPLTHYGTSELKHLGDAVLGMGTSLQNRETTLRAYADHVTHELKSPLTALRGASELLQGEGLRADQRAALVGQVAEAGARMQVLLDAQRRLAVASETPVRGRAVLGAALAEVVTGLEIEADAAAQVPLSHDALVMILTHLLGNAEANGAGAARISFDGDTLRIADDGPGISPGNQARIFDPFFTTRRGDGGTGMGLAILRRMIEANGGEIALEESARGACFAIRL